EPHPDRHEATVEDVGAVPRAVHPARHHVPRGPVTVGDVLPAPALVAGAGRALARVAAVPPGVAEVVVDGHVLAVEARGGAQPLVGAQFGTAGGGPLRVGEGGDLVLPRGDLVNRPGLLRWRRRVGAVGAVGPVGAVGCGGGRRRGRGRRRCRVGGRRRGRG